MKIPSIGFIVLAIELFSASQDLKAQMLLGNDSLGNRKLHSFVIHIGGSWTTNSTKIKKSYFTYITHGTSFEKYQYIFKKGEFNSDVNNMNLGFNLGWKLHIKNSVFNYAEITAGAQLGLWTGFILLEHVDPRSKSQAAGIEIKMISVIPSVGLNLHSKPILKNFAFIIGTNAGIAATRFGFEPGYPNNSLQGYIDNQWKQEDLTYKYGNNYLLGLPTGIKYNASCDLNVEMIYQPYYLFNTYTSLSENATLFNCIMLQLRYKLGNQPINPANKRTDMFF